MNCPVCKRLIPPWDGVERMYIGRMQCDQFECEHPFDDRHNIRYMVPPDYANGRTYIDIKEGRTVEMFDGLLELERVKRLLLLK